MDGAYFSACVALSSAVAVTAQLCSALLHNVLRQLQHRCSMQFMRAELNLC
jgi:hypothetical protein